MTEQTELSEAIVIINPAEDFTVAPAALRPFDEFRDLEIPANAVNMRCQLNTALYIKGQMLSQLDSTKVVKWVQPAPRVGVTATTLDLLAEGSHPVVVANLGSLFSTSNIDFYTAKPIPRNRYLDDICEVLQQDAKTSLYILSLGIELRPGSDHNRSLIDAAMADTKEQQLGSLVGYTTKLNGYQALVKPIQTRFRLAQLLSQKSGIPAAEVRPALRQRAESPPIRRTQ